MLSLEGYVSGYLKKDPEMRYTPTGRGVTSFEIVDNRSYNDNNGNLVKRAQSIRFQAWGKQALNINQWCVKGQFVVVKFRLPFNAEGAYVGHDGTTWDSGPHVWTDNSGKARASWEFEAIEVKFGPKSNGQGQNATAQVDDDVNDAGVPEDNTLPTEPPAGPEF